jgi:hypothetical protein
MHACNQLRKDLGKLIARSTLNRNFQFTKSKAFFKSIFRLQSTTSNHIISMASPDNLLGQHFLTNYIPLLNKSRLFKANYRRQTHL